MKSAESLSQNPVDRLRNRAQVAWDAKDFKQGIQTMEMVSRLAPANGAIWLQLGHYYGLRYDYAAAEQCFDRAIGLAPGKTAVVAQVAGLCAHFANQALAVRYFHQALKQPDASAAMCVRLAELYDRLGRSTEARALLDRALGMNPAYTPAIVVCARLDRQAGRLEDAERWLRRIRPNSTRSVLVHGYYELGQVLDQQGRYDEAMAAFLSAKEILRAETQRWLPELKKHRAVIREQQAWFSTETLNRWREIGDQLQPRRRIAFLGGHPRSGTTLLEQVLDSHPGIIAAGETQVFSNDALSPLKVLPPHEPPNLTALKSLSRRTLQTTRANYYHFMEKVLASPIGDRLLIDKNPALMALLPAFVRIFPEVKILVPLRDPRDVVLSCFMQTYLPVTLGSVAYQTLEETVEGCALIMTGWKSAAAILPNPWLEVRYEEMVDDLPAASKRVFDFLGLPWDPRVLEFYQHAQQKHIRSPTYAEVTRPIFKRAVGRWRNYQKYLEPHLPKLEPILKALGYAP
jgi:tetratricopeptide (TPR) repeat protein